jgi:hypothetical protein
MRNSGIVILALVSVLLPVLEIWIERNGRIADIPVRVVRFLLRLVFVTAFWVLGQWPTHVMYGNAVSDRDFSIITIACGGFAGVIGANLVLQLVLNMARRRFDLPTRRIELMPSRLFTWR